jgi:release factor glutamine methyltransferase
MKSFGHKLKSFLSSNRLSLENSFPGINLRSLENAYFDFSGRSFGANHVMSIDERNNLEKFLNRVIDGVPFSYITNKAHFYGLDFYVNESVLIPRFETEVLVEECLSYISTSKKEDISLLDVGIGSGCVGLAILSEAKDKVISLCGTDISESALEVANNNKLKLEYKIPRKSSVDFILSDRLEGVKGKRFDFIVSNPPYIKFNEDRKLVHHQVTSFEPELALFLEDKSYDSWFEKFFRQVYECLNDDGVFLMEGHENHLDRLEKLAIDLGFKDTSLKNDLTGRLRLLTLRKGK